MIITDKEQLKQICKPCESIEEGEEIGAQLLKELTKSNNGIGLAANQIGINKRVCVINIKEPVVLINPVIVEKSEEQFVFPEGCLSFPNVMQKTKRHMTVKVEADNHQGQMVFTAEGEDMDLAMECACVQHEIDHLDGITMFDKAFVNIPWKRKGPKIGRNDKVLVAKGTDSKVIKYKKFEKMEKDGWVLVEV